MRFKNYNRFIEKIKIICDDYHHKKNKSGKETEKFLNKN